MMVRQCLACRHKSATAHLITDPGPLRCFSVGAIPSAHACYGGFGAIGRVYGAARE